MHLVIGVKAVDVINGANCQLIENGYNEGVKDTYVTGVSLVN